MRVEVGRHTWDVNSLQYDKTRRKYWDDEQNKLDVTFIEARLSFSTEEEAIKCFNEYEERQRVRLDRLDVFDRKFSDEDHLTYINVDSREGKQVVLSITNGSSELLNSVPTNGKP